MSSTRAAPLGLTPLEIAAGTVIEPSVRHAPPVPLPTGPPPHPRARLERLLLDALKRPPCLVGFSGGRDSSVLLALAATVARRSGLPAPIPLTVAFDDVPDTDERAWQELVLRHINVDHWEHLSLTDEWEVLGATARRVLTREGLLYNPTIFQFLPLLQAAAPGTLVTGIDGDSVFSPGSHLHLRQVLFGAARPTPRDGLRAMSILAPPALREARMRRLLPNRVNWLTAEGQRLFTEALAAEHVAEPLRWDRRSEWLARTRGYQLFVESESRLAASEGARSCSPFLDGELLRGLGRFGGRAGFVSRSSLLIAMFSDLLPQAVLTRESKADFTEVTWRGEARRFASVWHGEGVSADLVDPDALLAEWHSPAPHYDTVLLLHQAWLASAGKEAAQDVLDEGHGVPAQRSREKVAGKRRQPE